MYTFFVIFATVITFAFGSGSEDSDEAPKLAHVSYKDGDTVTITCPFESEFDVKWSRNSEPVDDTLIIEDTDIYKYVVNQTGDIATLQINRVYKEDAGNYTCIAGDQIDEASVVGMPRFLDHHVKSVTVTEGGDLVHQCRIAWTFPEDLVITWYRGETQLRNDDMKYFITDDSEGSPDFGVVPNGQLTVKDLEMDDRDHYTCKVDNGVVSKRHTVLLRVKSKLAAVWPLIGIILEVIILVGIILLWERNQKKQREASKNE